MFIGSTSIFPGLNRPLRALPCVTAFDCCLVVLLSHTPGIIIHLVEAASDLVVKVADIRLERNGCCAEYRQQRLECLHPTMGIMVGIMWG